MAFAYYLLPAQTNVWNTKTPMPAPGKARFLSAGFAIGTKLYFCTGMDDSFQALPDFWEYNTANDTWTQKTDFPGGARYGATGFAINGKGYIALGTNGTAALDDLWEFDPAGNAGAGSWTQKQNYGGSGRAGAFVFVVDNKAYVGTGQDVSSVLLSDMWMYDPTNNTWTNKQSVPGVSRMYAAAFAIGSKGYMGTGIDSNDDGLATFFEYDPANNQWTAKAPYGGGAMQSAVGFALNNRGYIGRGGNAAFWQYNPNLNQWIQKADLSLEALLNAVGVVSGTKAYYFSGYGVSLSAALKEYTPDPTLTDQTITFSALPNKTVGAANFNLTATASSGLTVAYTSSNTSVATVSGNTVTIVGAGTTTITATQAGNATYDPAPPVEQVLTVDKASQTITFNALPAKTNTDAPFTLTATSTSGLAVAFTSSNTSVATVEGTTVTILSAGTTIITASQSGNAQYLASALVDQTLTVNKGTPTWTGALPTAAGYNNDLEVTLSLSNSLTYTLTSANPAIASVALQGNKWVISPKALGSVDITATRAADANFNAAPTLTATLVVGKGTQTITVENIPAKRAGDLPFQVTATSTSGSPVAFSAPLSAFIQITSGGLVSIFGGGTTVITAQAAGNDLYLPVTTTFNLNIGYAPQQVTFDALKEQGVGDAPVTLYARSSASLPVTYTSSNTAVATVSGNKVTAVAVGTTTITASSAGNYYYQSATPVTQVLTVRQPHTLTFTAPAQKTIGDAAFTLSATSSASLPVVFTVADPSIATVSGASVTIKAVGSTLITATAGNDTYTKREVTRLLVVKNVTQTAAEQGQLWGVLSAGGVARNGSIFLTNADGTGYAVVKEFKSEPSGVNPQGSMALASNGKLYGVTAAGGDFNGGVLFEFDPADGKVTVKKSLPVYSYVRSLKANANGKVYGVSSNGIDDTTGQLLFEYDVATGTFTKKISVSGTANNPQEIFFTANGKMFLAATVMAPSEKTGLLEVDVATATLVKRAEIATGQVTVLFGAEVNGKIYFVTNNSYATDKDELIEFDMTTFALTVKQSFTGAVGSKPRGLVQSPTGKMHGVTTLGGPDNVGTIFEYDAAGNTLTVKQNFSATTGGRPNYSMTLAANGKYYGAEGTRELFEFDPATGVYKSLPAAGGDVGSSFIGRLAAIGNKLFGAGGAVGTATGGTLFELDAITYATSKKAEFKNTLEGATPEGDLRLAGNGKFYGITHFGGKENSGTIFEIDPATHQFQKVFDFPSIPSYTFNTAASMTLHPNGKFYGTRNDLNYVFEFDPATFAYQSAAPLAGQIVYGKLALADDGTMWGTTWNGGTGYKGIIFQFNPETKTVSTKFDFTGANGEAPYAGVTIASNGKIYGVTSAGGANNLGVIFEYDRTTEVYTLKHSFATGAGTNPVSNLVEVNAKLYGITPTGGTNNFGIIFEFDIATGTFTKKFEFTTNSNPQTGLWLATNGKLYGTTKSGGAITGPTGSGGFVFEFDPVTSAFKKTTDLGPSDPTSTLPLRPTLSQALKVMRLEQTIAFDAIAEQKLGNAPIKLVATSSSGLPVTFTAGNALTTIATTNATLVNAGLAKIQANQPGNAAYNAAPEVVREFCINPVKPTVGVSTANPEQIALTSSSLTGNQWFKDGVAITGATNSMYDTAQPGVFTLQVTIDGCKSELSDDVPLVVTGDLPKSIPLTLYPNPTTDKLLITLSGARLQTVVILHPDGRVVTQEQTMEKQLELDVRAFTAGLYLVRVLDDNANARTAKFIKK